MFKQITKTVWLIAFISLFNDFSSEMLYPIIPIYLSQIGYGGLFVGIIEGIAECVSGFSKIYMGSVSDKFQKRLPFIQFGYLLSVVSRPIIGLCRSFPLIIAGRIFDKIGKGIRTGSRDAMLGDESTESNRAQVFGFHRSMDTLGAVLGPMVAIIYLHFYPEDYRSIFLVSIVPGFIAIGITGLIKEKEHIKINGIKSKFSLKENLSYYKKSPVAYKQFLIPLLLFALINSSDMFLLLHAKSLGISGEKSITFYLFFNLVFAFSAFPIGKLADRFGKMLMLKIGLVIYAVTYFLFSIATLESHLFIAFVFYGLYYSFTQGIIKSLVVEKVASHEKASAIGLYEGLSSFCLLFANAFAGFVWEYFGANTLFLMTASITLFILIYFLFNTKQYLVVK
jgi:MFS family permease